MTEESMSSNKRIQLLRERLEMYNATIAEAMGVVADVSKAEKGAARKNNMGASRNNDGGAAGAKRQEEVVTTGNVGRGFAPRLDRDLGSEFDAVHLKGDASRRYERRVVPPPPSPPKERQKAPPMLSSTTSSSSGDGEESTTSYSENNDGAFENPFLNDPISMEEIPTALQGTQQVGNGARTAGGGEDGSPQKNSGAFSLSPGWMKTVGGAPLSPRLRGDAEEIDRKEVGAKEERGENMLKPRVEQRRVSREADAVAVKIRAGEMETRTNAGSSLEGTVPPLPFDTLEIAYNKLKIAEQAIIKLRGVVDVDHFQRSLPQREQAKKLANSRDELIKKEQALRQREIAGSSLATIYESNVTGVDKLGRQLLSECDAAKSLFTRVYDRKAALSEKEKLLKKRISELDERQLEVHEKRQALTALEQRTEQREALVLLREEAYKGDMEAHKAREQALHAKISEVEELSRNVSSWLKILEDRDGEMAAKEQRLRRVQSDLVRRSEELLCYRNGQAKQSARAPQRRVKSP